MWQRFTERARRVILLGQDEAGKLNSGVVGTEHLLLGLLREDEGVGARVLQEMGLNLGIVRSRVIAEMWPVAEQTSGEPKLTTQAKHVLELAADEARLLRHNYIGTEHILMALLREEKCLAVSVLNALGIEIEKARAQVLDFLSANPEAPKFASPNQAAKVFSPQLAELLATAEQLKKEQGGDVVEIKDVLRALCQSEGLGAQILRDAGVDVEALRLRLEA